MLYSIILQYLSVGPHSGQFPFTLKRQVPAHHHSLPSAPNLIPVEPVVGVLCVHTPSESTLAPTSPSAHPHDPFVVAFDWFVGFLCLVVAY